MVPVAEKLLRHGTFRGKNLKQNLFSENRNVLSIYKNVLSMDKNVHSVVFEKSVFLATIKINITTQKLDNINIICYNLCISY